MTVHFDTLDYANTLEGAGISRAHAEAIAKVQARALTDLVTNELVTKDFLRSELTQLETRLRGEISQQGVDLRAAIDKQGVDLRAAIDKQGVDLRGEILQAETRMEAMIRRETDALRLQLRSLQFGGAIAAFAISVVILLSRLIK